jgi:alkylation response protein AidB-like acyl-CoA dehydrogenase
MSATAELNLDNLRSLDEVLATTLEIGRTVAAPNAEAVDRDAHWPEETLRALLAAGLGGLVVPAEHGGLGYGMLALARVCEELGRHCASSAISFGMHCVGAAVIAARPTPEQVERYLRPIARGEHLTTLSLSEPGTGAHFYFPQSRLATVGPEHFTLSGTKTFVTNGTHADSYVVSASSGEADGEFSCVVVRADANGISWGEPWQGLGMRGNSALSMRLDSVRVPRADLLGHEGDQIWYAFRVVAPYFLMAMAGTYLGVATAALAEAGEHLSSRRHEHTGASLAQQSVLQHRYGLLWATLERTRCLVRETARRADDGDPGVLPAVLSAKAEVAEAAVNVVNEALTLVGGIGYRESSTMGRHLRDVRAAHVMSPTSDMLRVWAGRLLLGQPLLAE